MRTTTAVALLRIDDIAEPRWNSADGKKWDGRHGEDRVSPRQRTAVRATVLQTLAGPPLPSVIEFFVYGDWRKRVERVDFERSEVKGGGFIVGEQFILPLKTQNFFDEDRTFSGWTAAAHGFANWRIAGTDAVNAHIKWNEPVATLTPKLVAAFKAVRQDPGSP